ncbi:hypothetical protein [Halosolutus gelatinilyticus]|uniref:hypothetical protein n=1 Tax=Halosolutus gelatinilyticus TaxID=2931975 RepID=UPI001FF26FBE|nr:hypothetical protein [Halosolutus gelatinilyticus]
MIDPVSACDANRRAIYVVDTTRYGLPVLTDAGNVLGELEERGRDVLDGVDARAGIGVTIELRGDRPDEEVDADADDTVTAPDRSLVREPTATKAV